MMTFEEFKKTAGLRDEETHLSVSWSGGGSWGNCWDDSIYTSPGEPEPEFTGLDLVLEATAPSLTFLQYKRVLRDAVELRENHEHDYYGGSGNTSYSKIADLRKLYDTLVEMGALS